MLPFFLYLITGLAFGVPFLSPHFLVDHFGKNSAVPNFVALGGFVGIIVSTFVSLYHPRRAAVLAFVSSCALWVIFGPAALDNLHLLLTGQLQGLLLEVVLPRFIKEFLLLMASCYAFVACWMAPGTHRLFPAPQPKETRRLLLAFGLTVFACEFLLMAGLAWLQFWAVRGLRIHN